MMLPTGAAPGWLWAEPLFGAVEYVSELGFMPGVVLMSPQGRPFSQALAANLSREKPDYHLYPGVDDGGYLVTRRSIYRRYVLTGGELPAAVLVDAVARLIPGVLGEAASAEEESFTTGLLEYPHYTRPREYRGLEVPEVLLSGHHEEIRKWRRRQSLLRTLERRPELLHQAELSREDKKILGEIRDLLTGLNLS